ncbi:MAG TPA: hypothetical protein VEB00_04630 [Clostridia bacterium]|nr:hypothetical protein [Clostridia bacterium]
MSIVSGSNGSCTFKAGKPIFLQGQSANSVNILAKGKVDVYISPLEDLQNIDENQLIAKSYKLFSIDQNIFIGANDLFLSNKHTFSYRASEDSIIFSYFVDNVSGIEELFMQKNDYSTYIMNSISELIEYSYASLQKLEQLIKFLSITADNLCLFFWMLKDKHGFAYEPVHSAFRDSTFKLQEMKEEKMLLPCSFDIEFLGCSHFEYDYFPCEEIDTLKMNYYKYICGLNVDLKKQFLNESFIISQYNCTDSSLLLESILHKIKEAFNIAEKYVELLYSENQTSILGEYLKAGAQLEKSIHDPIDMIEVQNYIVYIIKDIAAMFKSDYDHVLAVNTKSLEHKVEHSITGLKRKVTNTSLLSESHAINEDIPEELKNSAEKILEYSNISKERYDLFMSSLSVFRGLKEKLSDDEQIKSLRRDLTSVFFEVYEAVLKRVTIEKKQDKLFHMFLTYSYMDEKLLSPKNLWALYEISEETAKEQTAVFSMKSWLQLIYNKKKNPSVNDFSMDYFDMFRELKKQGEVKDEDKAEYENNADARLSFEISNMFKQNHRLCNRNISTYFPILYDEVIVRDMDKALVTPEKVNNAIQKVLAIDFSAFHRELSYFNMKKGIEKEFIMQSVRPDIILMPAYGTNSTMWQEISGRVRNTPGRFIIPIFTDGNIDDMIQRLIGEFRWELCKTMMGVSWNDISIKSLTSEYMDYLQFYKKNKDISEESKEKLKLQIKKYKNISRHIFASDYITWLNYESNGNTRLNKLTRDIFLKYCPFPKEIREKLLNHPSFAAAANQFRNLRAKQAKDLENRYARYTRKGIILDEEMIETLNFYKNL